MIRSSMSLCRLSIIPNELITLQSCLSSLHVWFCENGMALNPSKSDAILFGTAQHLKTMSSLTSVKIADSAIQFSDTVKILGVTLDSNLTLESHIKAISKSCFYHIRSFRQIRPSMDRSMAMAVASALVSARLDYVNSILFGCPQKHIYRLQRVQHVLARVVMQQAYRSSSSTELFKQLHSLPIEWLIRFKLATSTYKALHTGHPPYLTDLLQYHKSSVSTCSSTSQLLAIPGITHPLVLVPFTSLLREFGTPELLKFVNVKPWLHSDVT